QGGRSSGRPRTGRRSAMLHAVLLLDAVASLGGHRESLLIECERDLLEVFLATSLAVPGAEDLGTVRASAETITDHHVLAFGWIETAKVGPDVGFAVQLAPELDDART